MEAIRRNDRMRDAVLKRLQQVDGGFYARDLKFPDDGKPAERRRITEYTSGIIRRRRKLDFLIDHWARAPSGVHPLLRQILRIGVYELVILDRPPHAVVNASVEQAKRHTGGKSAAFVNAILRQVDRHRDRLPSPRTGDAAEDLAIEHSHPTWMVRRWLARYGNAATTALLNWNNRRPSFGLRINRLAIEPPELERMLDELGLDWSPGRYSSDYFNVAALQPVIASGLLEAGKVAVQDESAGLVVDALNPSPGEFVLDACAAPGGKLIGAGLKMKDQGRLLAVDSNRVRLKMAEEAVDRHGLSCVQFWHGSFLDLELPEDERPDRILLDVPCSGLGVLSRRADARWRKEPEHLVQLSRLQDRLLDRAADILKPGGIVVYATCTIEPEENEQRVEAFMRRHPGFREDPVTGLVPEEVLDASGRLATLPHVHQVDGAFAARLRKGK